jgi:hypothetical protein
MQDPALRLDGYPSSSSMQVQKYPSGTILGRYLFSNMFLPKR